MEENKEAETACETASSFGCDRLTMITKSAPLCSASCGCGTGKVPGESSECCGETNLVSGSSESPIRNSRFRKPSAAGRCKRSRPFIDSSGIASLLTICVCCIFLSLAAANSYTQLPDLSIIPTPPTFVHKKNPKSFYYVLDTATTTEGQNSHSLKEVEFPCKAKGYPSVTYKWLKDGSPLNFSDLSHRTVQVPNEGTFKLTKLRASDEGKYECIAENGNGTAVDSAIHLQQAYIKMFVKTDPELVEVELGDPYSKTCEPPPSVPDPKVYWIFMGEEQGRFNTINSSHISYTDEGTIYFHYIQDDDYKEKIYYTCTAENAELQDYKFGNRFQFIIKRSGKRLEPYIMPTEQYVSPDKTVLKGEEVKLHCFFSGRPDSIPEWRKGGKGGRDVTTIKDMKGRIDTENFGRTLVISNVSTSDTDLYSCCFESNKNLDRDIQVTVEAAPHWPQGMPPSQNASEGDSVNFICGAEGNPRPKFKFYKNGQTLSSGEQGYEINDNELRIRGLTRGVDGEEGHNAVYQCLASNRHGESWANFYLNILAFQPVILEGPGNTDAVMNSEKFLYCKVFGSPMPNIQWRGQALVGGTVEEIPVNPDGLAKLRIPSVSMKNAGRYSCYATNKYGTAEAEGVLSVRNATRLKKYPKPEETVFAGREHRFLCEVVHDKNLNVKVQWLHNGLKISDESLASGRKRIEQENGNNVLIIPETNGADSGTYTCIAESRLDKAERTVKLIVKDVPAPPHTSYMDKCENTSRVAVIRINHMEYEDVAAPVQEFWIQYMIDETTNNHAWTTFKTPLKSFKKKEVKQNIKHVGGPLTVDLRPYGKYKFRVIARNEVGDSAPLPVQGICTTVAAVPDENPSGVRVKGNTEDNLVIYWDPMPREKWNGPGFHYEVEYKKKDEDGAEETEWKKETVEDPYLDHLVIDNMPTYEEYEARVRAVNDEGKADIEPLSVTGHSGEGVPESPPTGFVLVNKTPSTMSFKWNPINESTVNGEVKGFKVYHWYTDESPESRRKKRGSPKEKVAYFDKDATEGTVYGMKPNKHNYAEIVVYNGANDSPRSEPIIQFLSPGPPSPVRDLNAFALSSSEIGVVWKPPREANGQLLGYQISYCQIETLDNGVVEINTGNCPDIYMQAPDTHYRWKLLVPNTEYRFEVKAESDGGVGDPTSVDERTLPSNLILEGAPYQPTLQEAGVGDDHINVTWIPGKFDESDKRPVGNNHYVKYRETGADEWKTAYPENGNFTVQVKNLDPGTEYEVVGVSVVEDDEGNVIAEKDSPVYYYTTAGEEPDTSSAAWLIAIIVAIIILIIILIILCLYVRNRGQKYPVSEKEREQGREPMLSKEEKGFGEYARPEMDDEKRSMNGDSKAESETDSMAEYGDGETGRFTEDGSFIGVYGAPNRVLIAPGGQEKSGRSNLSTFV